MMILTEEIRNDCRQAILRTMEQIQNNGDSYADLQMLLSSIEICDEAASLELDELIEQGVLYRDQNRIYTLQALQTEIVLADQLAARLRDNVLPWNGSMCLKGLFPEQARAVEMALNHRISLILGGAGTGKSTLLRELLNTYMGHMGTGALSMAPTGKAAANLRLKTGHPAQTVHAALGADLSLPTDAARQNWAHIRLIIVDEASMVTTQMLAAILSRSPWDCHIVLTGDPNQLQAVGPGRLMNDLLELGAPHTILRENHRLEAAQSALSWNVQHFEEIHKMEQLQFDDSFQLIEAPEWKIGEQVENIASWYYANGHSFQLLAATNTQGSASVHLLNQKIHLQVNPPQAGTQMLSSQKANFWDGDRVLITQNRKNANAYNGDVGQLRILPQEQTFAIAAVDFPGRPSAYLYQQDHLAALQHGYAITVHKSQGSEFDTILLPLSASNLHMATRNLFYTAISRARCRVILVGSKSAVEYALRTSPPVRKSGLVERTLRRQVS